MCRCRMPILAAGVWPFQDIKQSNGLRTSQSICAVGERLVFTPIMDLQKSGVRGIEEVANHNTWNSIKAANPSNAIPLQFVLGGASKIFSHLLKP